MSGVKRVRVGARGMALASALVLGVCAGSGRAQAQTAVVPPAASGSFFGNWWAGLDPNAPAPLPPGPASRFYGGADYLLWWVKGAPLPVPLITTGPIETTHHGWLVNSDTTILYGAHRDPAVGGNDSQSFPGFNGTRLTLGYWLDDAQKYAIEGRGFLLQTRTAGFSIHSDQNGLPVINIPNFTTIPYAPPGRPVIGTATEDGIPASLPDNPHRFDGNAGIFSGGVSVSNSLRFWGADATGVMNLYRTPAWEVSALGGFRYLDLAENFRLLYESTGMTGAYAGQYGAAFDVFQTRNQFYGASLGLRGSYLYGPFSVEMSGRVSLGVNHEAVTTYGGFYSTNYITPSRSGPEGIFAQPANTGRFTSNDFGVVPEAQVKLGYDVTPALRLSAGYDIVYESSVVRPGDQINRNYPKGQTFLQGGNIVSATSPVPLFNRTDFFAHGLTVGLSYHYGALPIVSRPEADMAGAWVGVPNWSGWYVGGNLGGVSGRFQGKAAASPVQPFTTIAGDELNLTDTDGSYVGGGQLGARWQFGRWVVGLEGDLEATGVERVVHGPGSLIFSTGSALRFKNDWQASLRARTGLAVDRWLAYATGGVAWAGVSAQGFYTGGTFSENNLTLASMNMAVDPSMGLPAPIATIGPAPQIARVAGAAGSDRKTLVGGTVGLGVEYALTDALSLGVEYRYTDYGKKTFQLGSLAFPSMPSTISARIGEQTNEVTARLNYRFGGLLGL